MEASARAATETWRSPDNRWTVKYSLALFYEIEFLIGEGYRRIPYGGIEHGGILFGRRRDDAFEITAFRQIECEHASGPSFSLTERDRQSAAEQMRETPAHLNQDEVEAIGLFISHGRRDLQVSEEERSLLTELFAQSPALLLIAKPERFKPTRFALAVHPIGLAAPGTLAEGSFILPLPPRQTRRKREDAPAPEPVRNPTPFSEEPPHPSAAQVRRKLVNSDLVRPEPVDAPAQEPEPAARNAAADDAEDMASDQASIQALHRATRNLELVPAPNAIPQTEPENPPGRTFRPAWYVALAALTAGVAVLLFWPRLSAPIELHAAATPGGVVISWSPSETSGSGATKVHVASSGREQVVDLSPAEKQSGRTAIVSHNSDITVELVVHKWPRDRHGVIRILRAP